MPDIFSYFSPKKLLPSPPRMVLTKEVFIDTAEPPEEFQRLEDEEEIQKSEQSQRQNISEDEGDVAGILNENYEEDCCSSSVENLSVALFKLESEKVTLDAEIRNKYNKISLGDMEELVEKIVSASGVDFIGDQEEIEEVSEIFELLKASAKFTKKRLRKLQENSEKKKLRDFDFLDTNRERVCVTDLDENSLEEEVETVDNVIEFLTKSLSPESLSKTLQKEEQTAECNIRLSTEEIDFPDFGEEDNLDRPEISEPELDTRTRNESATSDDLANSDNPKSPKSVKSRFGQVKNRLSLRRVFKKKSTTDSASVHEDNP